MTPKEMARNMVDEFTIVGLQQRNEGIECAIICVNYIVREIQQNSFDFGATVPMSVYTYWKNVIEEIEKL